MATKSSKMQLSKGILQMKFMSRTREKLEKEQDDAKGRALHSSEITDKMINESDKYVFESSFVKCEDLIDGRVSYGGMNPEIERILELERNKNLAELAERERIEAARRQQMRKDVPDQDMTKFYATVVKSVQKKYETKRLRQKQPLPLNIRRPD